MSILFGLIYASMATFMSRDGLQYRHSSPMDSPNSEKRQKRTDTTQKIISAESKCCVCYTKMATHAYLCGHRCICKHCCKKLLYCPICKNRSNPIMIYEAGLIEPIKTKTIGTQTTNTYWHPIFREPETKMTECISPNVETSRKFLKVMKTAVPWIP